MRRRRDHRARFVHAHHGHRGLRRAHRRGDQPDLLGPVHCRARAQHQERLQRGRPLRAVLRPRRAARFQHRVLFLLPRAVRGADSGDGSHPPDRRGHRPHPGGAYFFRHHAGLYVVRRYARRNHDRCSAVCDHYHRREPVRVSRHRPSRRLRRHDGDPERHAPL